MAFYTGVGSRETPAKVCEKMTELAEQLTALGLRLRSGHAKGADLAFEAGCGGNGDIYLPYRSFNNKYKTNGRQTVLTDLSNLHQQRLQTEFRKALSPTSAEQHIQFILRHRAYKLFHVRNVLQVLGHADKFVPSKFVIFYARPLASTKWSGGTNTAVQIARRYKVPYYNLYNDWTGLEDFIQKHTS